MGFPCSAVPPQLVLWLKTKLPPYDFSDLLITCELENRPGTGRLKNLCVVTYRRPASVYTCNNIGRCPFGHGTARPILEGRNIFLHVIMYTLVSLLDIMPPKKQVIKKRKERLSQTLTVLGGIHVPHSLKTAAIAIALVRFMLFILSF